jgi:uncharacterized phage protein (predicted DNA packaging)
MLITLDEAKLYLHIDSTDEDSMITGFIETAEKLCMNIARVDETGFLASKETARIAELYAVAYLYENRESADFKELTSMLRAILFGIRKDTF